MTSRGFSKNQAKVNERFSMAFVFKLIVGHQYAAFSFICDQDYSQIHWGVGRSLLTTNFMFYFDSVRIFTVISLQTIWLAKFLQIHKKKKKQKNPDFSDSNCNHSHGFCNVASFTNTLSILLVRSVTFYIFSVFYLNISFALLIECKWNR